MTYTPEKFAEILRKHALWLARGGRGERANFCGANLSRVDLRGADLRGADLRGADLSWANLRGTKGIYLLPVQDPRGYSWPHGILCSDGEWRIRAGCRFFTIPEARAHWGETYKGNRRIGDMYLAAVDWLEKVIAEDYADAEEVV